MIATAAKKLHGLKANTERVENAFSEFFNQISFTFCSPADAAFSGAFSQVCFNH